MIVPFPRPQIVPLTAGQIALRLFLRAGLMSGLQAGGVVLLAKHSAWSLVTAFLISWFWTRNVVDTVDYRHRGVRLAYAAGGACGAGLVLLAAWWTT